MIHLTAKSSPTNFIFTPPVQISYQPSRLPHSKSDFLTGNPTPDTRTKRPANTPGATPPEAPEAPEPARTQPSPPGPDPDVLPGGRPVPSPLHLDQWTVPVTYLRGGRSEDSAWCWSCEYCRTPVVPLNTLSWRSTDKLSQQTHSDAQRKLAHGPVLGSQRCDAVH